MLLQVPAARPHLRELRRLARLKGDQGSCKDGVLGARSKCLPVALLDTAFRLLNSSSAEGTLGNSGSSGAEAGAAGAGGATGAASTAVTGAGAGAASARPQKHAQPLVCLQARCTCDALNVLYVPGTGAGGGAGTGATASVLTDAGALS